MIVFALLAYNDPRSVLNIGKFDLTWYAPLIVFVCAVLFIFLVLVVSFYFGPVQTWHRPSWNSSIFENTLSLVHALSYASLAASIGALLSWFHVGAGALIIAATIFANSVGAFLGIWLFVRYVLSSDETKTTEGASELCLMVGPPTDQIRPRRNAITAACVRSAADSFSMISRMWPFTVPKPIDN